MTETDEAIQEAMSAFCVRAAILVDYHYDTKKRPVLGGTYGHGGYSLVSFRSQARGLYCVYYSVVHDASGTPLSFEHTQADALAEARRILRILTPVQRGQIYQRVERSLTERAAAAAQAQAEIQRVRRESTPVIPHAKTIPKRRRQVFEKSGGRCHYCDMSLTLDGRWHIEHKMPRALLGGSEMHNLVASCASCNHRKKDKTDLEFIALQQERAAT